MARVSPLLRIPTVKNIRGENGAALRNRLCPLQFQKKERSELLPSVFLFQSQQSLFPIETPAITT
jgi:hypothetical protein